MPLDERAVALEAHANVFHRLAVYLDIALAVLVINSEVSGQAGAGGFFTAKMPPLHRVLDQVAKRFTNCLIVDPDIRWRLQLGPLFR